MSDLERELESELHRVLDPMSSLPIPPRRAAHSRMSARTLLGGAGAALTFKILTGVAAAAAAVTVVGAATTGSLNPTVWGQQVEQQVQTCKDELTQGDHGIGQCVSSFASQHGQAVASSARHHGNGNGNGEGASKSKDNNGNPNNGGVNGAGNGNASSHPKDKSGRTPGPPASPGS
jgi:hypothetical protein